MKLPIPSKEQQLLFDLLRGEKPNSLNGMDTGMLFDLFRRHRLFPLASALFPLLNEEERGRWKQAMQARTLRSMRQLAACGKLTEAFKMSGMEAIPFKGPVLAHCLFGNVGERHSSDLDILVRNQELHRIIELANKQGFELTYPRKGLTEGQWKHYLRYKKDIGLQNRDQGIFVELHFSFENYLGLSPSEMDYFVRDIKEVRIGEHSFLSMTEHQTFLYLVLHGGVHQFRRLFWLRDVAKALSSWELDHHKILADAKAMGIDRLLGISLVLARDICNEQIPEVYREYLVDHRRQMEKLKAIAYGFILGQEYPNFRGKIRHHLFMLRVKPDMSHYIRTFKEIMNRLYIGRFLGGH